MSEFTSIHYYTFTEFENLLYGLEDNNALAYDKLYRIFRECTNLKKTDELKSLTVGELKNTAKDTKLRLFRSLRNALPPKEKLDLPLGVSSKSKDRKAAIKKRIEQMGYSVINFNHKCIEGHAKYTRQDLKGSEAAGIAAATANENFDNTVQFPFLFEAAIATVVGNFNRKVHQLINNSPRYNTTVFKVDIGENMFRWITKHGSLQFGYSIENILDKYGYTGDHDPKKPRSRKPNSIIMVNLISPKLEYKDYGKTSINLEPFRDAIGETIYKVCGCGGGRSGDDRPSKVSVVLEILTERKQKWYSLYTASERQKHLWTQSDAFYASRKRLIECGYTNDEIDREYITGLIKDICENKLGVKREDIGITAADRAQLYFKGKWMDVGLKEIRELSLYGIDLLIIEKEGIAEQLAPFADEKGIALLYTRGFLTDYASVLSETSAKEGCNIAILTDFDDSGLAIAREAPDAYRIGIDFETLEDLGLDIEDVQEEYNPGNHLKTLQLGGKHAGVYSKEMVRYVEDKRVV